MRGGVALIVAGLLLTVGLTTVVATAPAHVQPSPSSWQPVAELARDWQGPPAPTPAAGLGPVHAPTSFLADQPVLGHTPSGWIAQATTLLDTPANSVPLATTGAGPLLAQALLDLHAGRGEQATLDQRLAVQAAADRLDPAIAAPLAAVVHALAEVVADQQALADGMAQAWPPVTFDPAEPLLAPEDRTATLQRAQHVLAALEAFRVQTAPLLAGTQGTAPIFEDPLGLVVVASTGPDDHGAGTEPVLLIEPGGDDVYRNRAGAADPLGLWTQGTGGTATEAVSVVYDVAGDDTYTYDGAMSLVQGAGSVAGLGMLVDLAGSDTYEARMVRTDAGPSGPLGQYYFDGGAQGHGFGGVGLLLEAQGQDTYDFTIASPNGRAVWGFAQGFGAAGGLGVAADAGGSDAWLAASEDAPYRNGHFMGMYVQGAGFYAGVGIVADTGLSQDRYQADLYAATTDYYSQGFGAFGGLGVQYEDGGDDTYWAVEEAWQPWINPLLNCAYGTASAGGVGVFVDVAGHDSYYGDTITPRTAATMNEGFGGIGAGYGLFVDGTGDDDHVMLASGGQGSMVSGRGEVDQSRLLEILSLGGGANVVGNYLDAGGDDVYVGPGADGEVWVAGADVNLLPHPLEGL